MKITEQPAKKRRWTIYLVRTIFVFFILLVIASLTFTGPYEGLAAHKIRAANQITQIFTASQGYRTEYGELPESSENYRLKKILCGDNQRGIAFLVVKPSDLNPNGEMTDPWGTPFRIIFDSNSKVHVISAGPDKIFGTADDITNHD